MIPMLHYNNQCESACTHHSIIVILTKVHYKQQVLQLTIQLNNSKAYRHSEFKNNHMFLILN